ncbi:MAG: Wzz/FepE/Etk N-terminal domain-containing protein [Methylococcales bacterium]
MDTQEYLEYPEELESKSLREYFSILKRHKGKMLSTGLSILLTSLCIAFLWPPTYTSTATILIEQPIITNELVDTTIVNYADQQVQRIQQRVLSRPNLRRIIRKFNLYEEGLKRETWSTVLADMNDSIAVDMVSADVVDPRSGRPTKVTIAFQVGFDHKSPSISQRVANELVSLFLQENMKERTESAVEASNFFSREADKLSKRMEELDTKLFTLKKERGGSLPEFQQDNIRILERAYQRLEDIGNQYNKAFESKIFLQSQLTAISPYSSTSGDVILDDKTRLKMLQVEHSNLLSRYSATHPDVIKVKTEINALSGQGNSSDNRQALMSALKDKKAELVKLKESYSAQHPDVIGLTKEIQNLQTQVASLPSEPSNVGNNLDADSPAYMQTQAQIKSIELELLGLEKSRKVQNKRIAEYEQRISMSPDVERQYTELMRKYATTKIRYEKILSKQANVNLTESIEKSRKGERYLMTEPPELPETPTKPNRIMIISLGLLLSAVAAIAATALAESLDQGIYGARQLATVSGETPLSVVPYMQTTQERLAQQIFKRRILLILLFLIVTAVLLGYFLYVNGLPDWLSEPST